MNVFYASDIVSTLSLPEEESKHCIRVLRHEVGDIINVIDGVGGMYSVKIKDAHPKRVVVDIISVDLEYATLPYCLHMAVAPTKNIDRFEWYVEKSTEIGIASITPIVCRFSERRVFKSERIEKILLSASKQSYKAKLPILSQISDVKNVITHTEYKHKFIAHCYDDIPKEHLFRVCPPNEDVLIMIGPEGDFSREEVELALANGFKSVSLGKSRLRTETAGVVACNIVSLVNA